MGLDKICNFLQQMMGLNISFSIISCCNLNFREARKMGLDKVCNFLQQMMGLNISCILVGIPKVGFSLSLSLFFSTFFFLAILYCAGSGAFTLWTSESSTAPFC